MTAARLVDGSVNKCDFKMQSQSLTSDGRRVCIHCGRSIDLLHGFNYSLCRLCFQRRKKCKVCPGHVFFEDEILKDYGPDRIYYECLLCGFHKQCS